MKERTAQRIAGWTLILLIFPGCSLRHDRVTVAGSTAFHGIMTRLAGDFMGRHPGCRVDVQPTASAAGIQAVRSGAAEIGVSDFRIPPEEAGDLDVAEVAKDGISVIVHPGNTVSNLSLDNICAIFSGKIVDWKDMGGPDHPIHVVKREPGSGTRAAFEKLVGQKGGPANVIIDDTSGAVRSTVANDPYAVGYLSHGCLNEQVRAVIVDGRACTDTAIATGEYPLVHSVYVATRGSPRGWTAKFLEYVRSEEGQARIREAGFLPVP